jgi:hypothetical protein
MAAAAIALVELIGEPTEADLAKARLSWDAGDWSLHFDACEGSAKGTPSCKNINKQYREWLDYQHFMIDEGLRP